MSRVEAEHGLALTPVNVSPAATAIEVVAAVERYVAQLRAENGRGNKPVPNTEDEAEGMRP